ncbi:hypothetical protein EGW08_016390, partial [Elysia chlorotica]
RLGHDFADDAQVDSEGEQHRDRQGHLLPRAGRQQEHQDVQQGQHHHGDDGVQHVERPLAHQFDHKLHASWRTCSYLVCGRVEVGTGHCRLDVPLAVGNGRVQANQVSTGLH